MENKFICVILLFIINPNLLFAQETNANKDKNLFHIAGEDFTAFYKTGAKVFTAPLHFTEKDWIITGSVVSATALGFLIDKNERTFWQDNRSKTLNHISDVGYFYGDIKNAAIISGAIYLGGIVSGDEKIHRMGRHLFEGLFFAGATNLVIKTVFGRSRPYTNDGPYHFKAFQTNTAHTSLPSGHITVAFTVSSVLANEIDNTYVSIILYSLAGSTFLQRMYDDKHWLSDSILAAAIGYFVGGSIVGFDEESTSKNISLNSYLLPNGMGLNFVFNF